MSATYACGFRQQLLMLHTSRTLTSLTVEMITNVMQHCLSAKGDQEIVVPIATEQPCMTLVNSAAHDQQE